MDSSDRLALIRGDLSLSPSKLSAKEAVAVLDTAIGYCKEVLNHLPMTSISEIGENWRQMVALEEHPALPRIPAEAQLLGSMAPNTRLMLLAYPHGSHTVGELSRRNHKQEYLLINRKGELVVWTLSYQQWGVQVSTRFVYCGELTSPHIFEPCDSKRLLAKTPKDLVEIIEILFRATRDAHERRLEIANALQRAEFNLRELNKRVGNKHI